MPTALGAKPLAVAIAFNFPLLFTLIGPEYRKDDLVGYVPSVV